MNKLEDFIKEWFPKTEEWDNVVKFILESGVEFTEEENPKWLTGYTNIGRSVKPHHKDKYTRYMEESMFILHDVIHQIFTLDTECSEDEYVKRQIYGELFTFYLTEYVIPKNFDCKHELYLDRRECYDLMRLILGSQNSINIIDNMYNIFILDLYTGQFYERVISRGLEESFKKYSKMFKEDLENSRKNYKFVPKIKSYCMVGESSQNHIDFFEAIKKGAIKNIKREFKIELPKEWI